MYRDSSFGLDDIQNTMYHLYLNAKSYRNECSRRIAGRDAVMSTDSVACCNDNHDQDASRIVPMAA